MVQRWTAMFGLKTIVPWPANGSCPFSDQGKDWVSLQSWKKVSDLNCPSSRAYFKTSRGLKVYP